MAWSRRSSRRCRDEIAFRDRPQLELCLQGKAVDIKQIGRELGVRYVLEGSVRKAGERVRMTGQLIVAYTDAYIWAASSIAISGASSICRIA